ncbi:hypothetical protein GGQ80_002408 [Sphingomonas jinjuensis]|uniref:Hemerythrin-like domain-containing protein n=1 Tax=Sphingomonas jinjuensis TaxID=535907 RepID=A0A840FMH7_9SPHN|nr:hemerythrin domain-containing protein [Sphingomonas jinjuensis]MBB4154495.1 hypothetical protein [Sphingomonas jinjuensis]
MLNRLRRSHRGLEAAGAEIAALLNAKAPDPVALPAARWNLATLMTQHMAMEDRHLFAYLVKDPRPEVARIGRRYREEFAGHFGSYADYAKRWTAERVAEDWPGYQIAARDQLRLLSERIAQVERDLFPLVEGCSINGRGAISTNWARDVFAVKDSIAPQR